MLRQQTLKRSVAALAVMSLVAGTLLAVAGPAAAGGYRHHGGSYSYSYSYGGYRPYYGSYHGSPYRYGHGYRYSRRGHHGYRYSHHGHGSDGALIAGALGAGLLLGYVLTRPASPAPTYTYRRAVAVQPAYGYGNQVRRDCKPTTGTGLYQGRPAKFGGTFCYDANGQGYIVPGSQYVIGYTN